MNALPQFLANTDVVTAHESQLLHLALEQHREECAILSCNLIVQWIAPRLAARLGVQPAAAIGRDWSQLCPEAISQLASYRRAARGEALELPNDTRLCAGRWCNVATRLQPLLADGRTQALLVAISNVAASTAPSAHSSARDFVRDSAGNRAATDSDSAQSQQFSANTQDLFRVALDCAQIGFYERDIESDVVRGLEGWFTHMGLPAVSGEQGQVARWVHRIHPDDLPAAAAAFEAHLSGETALAEAEYRVRSCAGDRWIWTLDRARVTERDASGRALRLAGIVMDIDQRKRLETNYSATESRLTTAIWGANLGLWELDLRSNQATWFSDWCRAENIEACAGSNHVANWDANIHPDDLPAAEQLFSKMLAGAVETYEAEYRIRTRDGEWRWIFERGRAVHHDVDGKPTRVVGICMNIDARKQAEDALKRSEFRYRSVAELTPGYIAEYAFSDDGVPSLGWVSEGFQSVFGESLAEFKTRPWDACYFDDTQRLQAHARAQALMSGERTASEARVRHRDGTPRWLSISTIPLRDPQSGRVTSALGVTHDITQRRLAEDALRESQRNLRSMAENSPDWHILLDSDWRVRFVNRPVNGVATEDLIGIRITDVAPQSQRAEFLPFLHRIFDEGLPSELEVYQGDRTDPQCVQLHRGQPIVADGRIVGAVINSSDITQRVLNEQQLRLQAHILETMREGVVLLDTNRRIRITNRWFDSMFGSESGALTDCLFESLLAGDEHSRRERAPELLRKLERGERTQLEFECQRTDGTVFAAASLAVPTSIGGVEHLLLVLTDVTDRKVLEREILEVSNREQQRIGADLHDGLGQELTGIALMLRGLAADIHRDSPSASCSIDEIIGLVNHAIELTRSLAHGLSPVSLERGGLLTALRTLATRASASYGIDVTLRTRLSVAPRLDAAAANHLHRIVQEALSNALRHGQAHHVRIHLASDEQSINLSIRDDGAGIRRIDGERHGLGLRTMNYRAQVIGGELEVLAHPQGGTVVRCICPQGARIQPRASEHVPVNPVSAP